MKYFFGNNIIRKFLKRDKKDLLVIKKKDYLILFLIVLFIFFLRFVFFSQTDFFSDDKSYHDMRVIENIEENGDPLFEDDLSYGGRTYYFTPLYHYIMAFFYSIFNSIMVLKIINNIFAVLLVIPVFFIVRQVSESRLIIYFAVLLSGFLPIYIKNTLNVLNPYSIFFPILLLIFYFITNIDQNPKNPLIITILMIFFILLSPLSIIVILSLLFNQILLRIDGDKLNKKEFELFFVFFLFYLSYYFILYNKVIFNLGLDIFRLNLSNALISQNIILFSPLKLLFSIGLIPFLIGSLSFYYIFFKLKQTNLKLYVTIIIMIAIFVFLNLMGIDDFALFLGVFLTILSIYGLEMMNKYFRNIKFKYQNFFFAFFMIVMIIPSIIISFNISQDEIKSSINEYNVETFNFIKNNIPENSLIITSIKSGHYVTYFSERKVVADTNFLMIKDIDQIFMDIKEIYTNPFYSKVIDLSFEKYKSSYILLDNNVRVSYLINDLKSYDESCFDKIYENKKTLDKIYQIIC